MQIWVMYKYEIIERKNFAAKCLACVFYILEWFIVIFCRKDVKWGCAISRYHSPLKKNLNLASSTYQIPVTIDNRGKFKTCSFWILINLVSFTDLLIYYCTLINHLHAHKHAADKVVHVICQSLLRSLIFAVSLM